MKSLNSLPSPIVVDILIRSTPPWLTLTLSLNELLLDLPASLLPQPLHGDHSLDLSPRPFAKVDNGKQKKEESRNDESQNDELGVQVEGP
jgi:hypothetical protein